MGWDWQVILRPSPSVEIYCFLAQGTVQVKRFEVLRTITGKRGCESRVAESEVFGWSRIPNSTRSRTRFYLSDSRKSKYIIFYITLLTWIPVEMVPFLMKLCWTENSCHVPRFPLSVSRCKIVDSQTLFTLCKRVGNYEKVGLGNFGKARVAHFTSPVSFFRWSVSIIFSWDILVTETFRSFLSQLYQNSP